MSRFDSESLNAPHTQRHLDEIPQRAPTAEKMAEAALARAGLVKRLRERQGRWMTPIFTEAADRIEQLERELAQRVDQVGRISESWAIVDKQLEAARKELAAEKALADALYEGGAASDTEWLISRDAYRKARGM